MNYFKSALFILDRITLLPSKIYDTGIYSYIFPLTLNFQNGNMKFMLADYNWMYIVSFSSDLKLSSRKQMLNEDNTFKRIIAHNFKSLESSQVKIINILSST